MNSLYLSLAIKEAINNGIIKLPKLAAVLVTRDKHVFIGRNRLKTHPLQSRFGRNQHSIYLHAEIDAIVQAAKAHEDITGSSLYIARVWRDGTLALAKPCAGCERAIVHFGIEIVEWTVAPHTRRAGC